MPNRSCSQPGSSGAKRPASCEARDPYSALLRVGFAMRAALPKPRCALAAPFHPCLCPLPGHRRFALCGTFPWPWPEGRRPAGVTRHPCFVEPGLSSRRKDTRLPGPLTAGEIGASHHFAKQKRCWTKVGNARQYSDDMEHMEHGPEEKNSLRASWDYRACVGERQHGAVHAVIMARSREVGNVARSANDDIADVGYDAIASHV